MEYKDEVKSFEEKAKAGRRYYFFDNWPMRGEKHLYQSAALFLMSDGPNGNKAIGGMVFDAEYLRDQFFPEMLDSLLSHQEERGEKNHVVMMIHPKHETTPLVASAGWDGGEPEVERNLEGAFPNLTLAIKLPGTTLAAMGQHFINHSFVILGAISLLLAGGIVMTHRNISREMALARLKSDFVSNVSHELRTPLSLIRLYAETLEMGRLKSPINIRSITALFAKRASGSPR